ncbi:MAG TPA: hypothetical protein VI603_01125, partial [Saprospiraceae bacterium]|nr:hypothetical protein [Saprospiraceae bacterium]
MIKGKCILMSAMIGMAMYSCQSDNLILEEKNMQFVGQFNKGFNYKLLGLGPLLQKLTFSQEDLIALAREEMPEAATFEEIFVVDVGFIVNPDDEHEAEFIDIKIAEDSSQVTTVFSIEDLFVNGELIIDPADLNLGDDYNEMLENLNELIQSGGITTYILDLFLEPQDGEQMT